jgi:hypothetical protein
MKVASFAITLEHMSIFQQKVSQVFLAALWLLANLLLGLSPALRLLPVGRLRRVRLSLVLREGGGGGLVGLPDVVKGASVFILTKTVSVCAGPVGSDRVCLEGIDCQVTSHGKKIKLEPGIYNLAPPTQYSKKVAYLSPVGDIALVQQYRDYLMTSLTTDREAWKGVFEVLYEA